MAEYVKRAFLLEGIELSIVAAKAIADGDSVALKAVDIMQTLRDFVAKAPAADVVPVVHGRWISHFGGWVSCSECETVGSLQWKGCPACLARMDGGDGNGI